jgi:O-antigen/teichoic acid export membrane protein
MNSIAKKSLETFAIRVSTQLVSAVGAIVIARALLATGKGEYTYAGTILGVALMAAVGHTRAVLWQYGRRGFPAHAVIRVMVFVVMIISVPTVLAMLLAGSLLPSQRSLLFVALALPFAIFSQAAAGIFLADGNVRTVNIMGIFTYVGAPLIYMPLVLFFYRSIWVVFGVWAASYVVAGIYTMVSLRRYYRGTRDPVDFKKLAKEQLTFGSQAGLSGLMQYLDFRVDVFLVMYMLGSGALGLYSVGIAIGEFIWQLSSAMINPSIGDIGGKDFARATEVTAKCMRHSFVLVFIAAVFVGVLARPIVPLIYGPAFSYGAVLTIALLPGIVCYSMMPALSAFFSQQLGQPRTPLYFSAISMVICAVVTVLTLPRFGLIAAAVATSISYTIAFIAAATYFTRVSGMSGSRIFAYSLDDLRPYYSLLTSAAGAIRGR